jgi:hypothetical protein
MTRRYAFMWALGLCGLGGAAAGAAAQVSSASAAGLGMGENFTAVARGVDAVAWNPSVLGLARTRGSSIVILTVRGSSGLGPVRLGDVADWSNTVVPDGVKQDWLARILAQGGQQGSGGGDITWLAVGVGPFALHASTSATALADVSPGVAELLLFGNVGASGQPQSIDLSGSSLDVAAFSAAGASFGVPVLKGGVRVTAGATVKFVLAHAMASGENSSGAATVNPASVTAEFPLVHTDFASGSFATDNGHGVGVDVGVSAQAGAFTFSGVVQNVVNTFQWNASQLRYRPLSFTLNQGAASTETASMPFASAPAELQARALARSFEPLFAGAVAFQYAPDLLFTADARFTAEDGIRTGAARHIGAGAEFDVTDWLPVRAGGAMISMGDGADGWQAGGGFGLALGSFNVSASALRRSAGRYGNSTIVMLSLGGAGR